MGNILVAGLFSMILGVLAGPRFISWLRSRGIGQKIREEGPDHSAKQGTPTMGGLLILARPRSPTSSSPRRRCRAWWCSS